MDLKKAEKSIDQIIKILNKNKLDKEEFVAVLAHVIYSAGIIFSQRDSKNIDIDTVVKDYETKPTIGDALILQGINMKNWLFNMRRTT